MKYISLDDLAQTIRKNIHKVPRDIDFIIGVPRSGMIAASIISSYLNVPLIDIDGFVSGLHPTGGSRLNYFTKNHQNTNKVLVIDDTVFGGTAMNNTKKRLSVRTDLKFVYMCVYLEGVGQNAVDIYLADLRQYTDANNRIVLYEWNIF
jgi:hypoxanthine phosphoribosyltransferase